MTVYVIQASPLSKIFQPDWHEKCLENPALVVSDVKFTVRIARPTGSIDLVHNEPVIASTLLPRTMTDKSTGKSWVKKVEEDVISPLVSWLTEENNSETDIYGVVAVPIESGVADAIMTLIHEKDAAKATQKLVGQIQKKMSSDITEARERADARVMRHCDKMYRVIMQTASQLKKENKGSYSPSYTEALALEILKDQITKRRVSTDRSQAIFDKAMAVVDQAAVHG